MTCAPPAVPPRPLQRQTVETLRELTEEGAVMALVAMAEWRTPLGHCHGAHRPAARACPQRREDARAADPPGRRPWTGRDAGPASGHDARSPRPLSRGGEAAQTIARMRRPRTRRAVQPGRGSAFGAPPSRGGAPVVTRRPRRGAPVRSRPRARAITGAGGARAGWTRRGSSRWPRADTPAPRA
jgi:hypothetical protein